MVLNSIICTGDSGLLYDSVHQNLFTLPNECVVYPAHDYNGSYDCVCSSNFSWFVLQAMNVLPSKRRNSTILVWRKAERNSFRSCKIFNLTSQKWLVIFKFAFFEILIGSFFADVAVPANMKCGIWIWFTGFSLFLWNKSVNRKQYEQRLSDLNVSVLNSENPVQPCPTAYWVVNGQSCVCQQIQTSVVWIIPVVVVHSGECHRSSLHNPTANKL